MLGYEVERTNGVVQRVDDDDGWEGLLVHDDIVLPGRIKRFAVRGARAPVEFQLNPTDILLFARRTRIALSDGIRDVRTLVGRRLADGLLSYVVIDPDGRVRTPTRQEHASVAPRA